jgi:hypothetical protein
LTAGIDRVDQRARLLPSVLPLEGGLQSLAPILQVTPSGFNLLDGRQILRVLAGEFAQLRHDVRREGAALRHSGSGAKARYLVGGRRSFTFEADQVLCRLRHAAEIRV